VSALAGLRLPSGVLDRFRGHPSFVVLFAAWLGLAGLIILRAHAEASVPAHNAASLTEAAPKPAAGEMDEKARRLFAAIVADDPAQVASLFLPREAFLLVKDMKDPGRYYDRLFKHYEADIHALHHELFAVGGPRKQNVEFVRFELSKRDAWMRIGEEGNRLPYWAARHSFIHYKLDGKAKRLEVRVLISWDDRWYITHLSEFH
jgi:hypothetical protein